MAKRKVTPKGPEYYESRRGDLSIWSAQPVRAKVTGAGVICSMRMPAGELEDIRQAAAGQGTTVSDFIRSAVAEKLRTRAQPVGRRTTETVGLTSGAVSGLDTGPRLRTGTA